MPKHKLYLYCSRTGCVGKYNSKYNIIHTGHVRPNAKQVLMMITVGLYIHLMQHNAVDVMPRCISNQHSRTVNLPLQQMSSVYNTVLRHQCLLSCTD